MRVVAVVDMAAAKATVIIPRIAIAISTSTRVKPRERP